MRNLLLVLALFPTLLFAQTPGFTLTGKVDGISDGEVKITSVQDNSVVASAPLKGGAFTLKGSVPEPGLYWMVLGSEQPQHIYLENNAITVTGSKKEIKKLKIEGSRSHTDFDQFRQTFNPLVGELNGIGAQLQKADSEQEADQLMKQYDSVTNIISSEVGAFITAKKSSFVSPFLLFVTAELKDDPMLMEQRYLSLDEAVRNSGIGKSLAEMIAVKKIGAVGTDALDFTQNDVNGQPVALSSFKGKYVLVDFWASWCKPCRVENPTVVAAFNKFKDKNFTVLGVSLDQEKAPWLRAIEKDKLTWTQVSDLKFWENEAAQLYRVEGIPFNMLVDPNGKIVARNLRGPALEAKLAEVLGSK